MHPQLVPESALLLLSFALTFLLRKYVHDFRGRLALQARDLYWFHMFHSSRARA